jgi:hypothetical protein
MLAMEDDELAALCWLRDRDTADDIKTRQKNCIPPGNAALIRLLLSPEPLSFPSAAKSARRGGSAGAELRERQLMSRTNHKNYITLTSYQRLLLQHRSVKIHALLMCRREISAFSPFRA